MHLDEIYSQDFVTYINERHSQVFFTFVNNVYHNNIKALCSDFAFLIYLPQHSQIYT